MLALQRKKKNNSVSKAHKILLGRALFELFEITTIRPSRARKQNKVSIDFYIFQSLLYRVANRFYTKLEITKLRIKIFLSLVFLTKNLKN